jgi:hypothetical protein
MRDGGSVSAAYHGGYVEDAVVFCKLHPGRCLILAQRVY